MASNCGAPRAHQYIELFFQNCHLFCLLYQMFTSVIITLFAHKLQIDLTRYNLDLVQITSLV